MSTIRYIDDKDGNHVFPVTHERAVRDSDGVTLETKLGQKQATLISGTNIKTVKGTSLLGPGNIDVQDGKSAYQLWLDQGNVGTEAEFIASLKGPQGNTGSSVDYPFELVNNLTTDDPTKALSAAQGKVLDGKIGQLEAKVTDLDAIQNDLVTVTGLQQSTPNLFDAQTATKAGILVSNGTVALTKNVQTYLLQVIPGNRVTVDQKTAGNRFAIWSFASYPQVGDTPTQTVSNNSANALSINLGNTEKYILIYINTGTLDASVADLRIYYGDTFVSTPTAANMCTTERADEIEDEVEDLAYKVTSGPLELVGTIAGKYIGGNGGTNDGGGDFSIDVFNVTNGDEITIVLSGGAGSSRLWGLYSGSLTTDVTSANLLSIGGQLSQSNGTNTITVSQNGILAVTKYKNATYAISKKVSEYLPDRVSALEDLQRQHYTLNDNELCVSFPYGLVDMLITLKPTGGNGLFEFFRFSTIPAGGVIGSATETLIFNAGTDWHGPYIVEAKSNINGDNKTGDVYNKYFTGGNHQYNNTGSGSTPTATLESIRFYIDGVSKTTGAGSYQEIRVEWSNLVQAYNTTKADGTGRAVLREKHTLEISGGKFSTTTEIIPLEDIFMETFYGLQYSGAQTIYPNTIFVGGANRLVYTGESNSGNRVPNGIHCYGTNHRLEMIGDITFDIGDRRLYDGTAGALRTTTKGYLYVVKDADMDEGEHYFLRGYWRFLPA